MVGLKIKSRPKSWATKGVWYVPNVGENRTAFLEMEKLGEKAKRSKKEQARYQELVKAAPGLFQVRLMPCTGNEYMEHRNKSEALQAEIEEDGTSLKLDMASLSRESQYAKELIRKRCVEVKGGDYEFEDEDGQIRTKQIANGEELVEAIDTADQSSAAILTDIFLAIVNRSHLEDGLKKKSP